MIDHLSFYATDFEGTRSFYDAVLQAMGYERTMDLTATWNPEWPSQRMAAWGRPGKSAFWLIETRKPATPRHLAFEAPSRHAVDAFYKAALISGGKDNGGPGIREQYHPSYYAAFVLDPDGNNIEAVSHAS